VPIVRLVLVLAACAVAVGQWLQERRRLDVVKGMSGRAGRDYLEATRERGERFMLVVTVVFALGAAAALVLTFGRGR